MIKFRASSVGDLLVGGNEITDKQREQLQKLLDRKNDPDAKPLTAKMQSDLDDLVAKRDAPFEFGRTARDLIVSLWLYNKFGYEELVISPEMQKGNMCEDEALGLISRQIPGGFRIKNEDNFENDWFTGTPDVVLDDVIEDVKCSWSIKTFVQVEHPSALYYAQGQVYMDLTGRDKFRLCHVLLPTPEEIVDEEIKRIWFKFGCKDDDPRYVEAADILRRAHNSQVDEPDRVRYFEFERSEPYLMKLRKRVEMAQDVYDSLTLRNA